MITFPDGNSEKTYKIINHKQPSTGILKKNVFLKICSEFTGDHPCRSVISINLQSNFIEIAPRHEDSPVNLLHIFRTPFYKDTSGRLLLMNEFDFRTKTPSRNRKQRTRKYAT